MDNRFHEAYNKINSRRLNFDRLRPKFQMIERETDKDDDGPELFTANPTDDIPRNKLTE